MEVTAFLDDGGCLADSGDSQVMGLIGKKESRQKSWMREGMGLD